MSTSSLFSETLAGASAEILVMLGTACILGFLMHWAFASNWKKRHQSIELKNRALDSSNKLARIKNDELESQLTQMANELKTTSANYKRTKTNLLSVKEKHSELAAQMVQFDFLAADHSKMKRKVGRLEKIKNDQKEQIDSLKVELLNSRIQASASTNQPEKESTRKKKPPRIDDLTRIQGIGPKTQSVLNEHGVQTFTQLGRLGIKKLKAMMEESGTKSRTFDPKAWAAQARELKNLEKV